MSENTDADDIPTGVVATIVAGTGIDNIDSSDPANPIINASTSGGVSAVRVNRTTSDPISGATLQVMTWENEEYDDDGFADLGTNDDRITIPAGVTRVNASVFMEMTNITASVRLNTQIAHFNSSDVFQGFVAYMEIENEDTTSNVTVTGLGTTVVAGDYLTVRTFHNDTSWNFVSGWFVVQDVSP